MTHREAFDAPSAPTTWRPIRSLGYLVFHVSPTWPGKYGYTIGFQTRTIAIWGRKVRP